MPSPSTDQVREILAGIRDVHLDRDLVSAGAVKDVSEEGGDLRITLEFGYPAAGYQPQLKSEIERAAGKLGGVRSVSIEFSTRIVAHAVQRGVKPLQHIRNTIAVASGKGGVGKS
ncbi:MAG: DUF59 domain-containing protein, partial [Elusimicrobia bacterium]|nr:DUF59 domain-containing protein [Elusimicrobiota bacterium]